MLDASSFSNSACILRLFRIAFEGYTSKLNSNDIEFGTAFHIFRKIFREKKEEGLAEGISEARKYFENTPMVIKSNKKYLTSIFLMKICIEYAEKYKNDSLKSIWVDVKNKETKLIQKEPLLEIKGAFPYYVDDEMEILMAFTIDEIGKQSNGITTIVDAKTTSMWDIKEYFHSFELSPQLRFYKWSLLKYAEAYPDSFIGKLFTDIVGCQIDGIFYKGAEQPVEYKRSDVMLFQDDLGMKEFEKLIDKKVLDLVESIKWYKIHNQFPKREGILNGACETKYGKCNFFKACAAVDFTTRDVILNYDFIKKQYNPLEFSKE